MFNKRSIIIVLIFLFITILVLISSVNVQRKTLANKGVQAVKTVEESKFKVLNYFSLNDGIPSMSLDAKNLKIVNNNDLYFTEPIGELYQKKGKISYQARTGSYLAKNKELRLNGEVDVKARTGSHKSQKLFYSGEKKYLQASGGVVSKFRDTKTKDNILITSNFLNSWLDEERSLFLGNVKGKVKRRRVYEESFNFKANRVEVNMLKSLVSLSEDVLLHRNNYDLEAQKAEIFLENYNKKLKYYVLYDDIKLKEILAMPDGSKQIRRAYSEKLEGYISEAKIVLSGAPRVEQGEDLIKGYQIILRENVELVEVDDSQSSFNLNKNK